MAMFMQETKKSIVLTRLGLVPVACLLMAACMLLSGCGEKTGNAVTVLAQVGDEKITNQDVDFTIERSFDRSQLTTVDASLQQKILDSLIASHAMKQLVMADMQPEEIQKIKNLSKAYEEELYVKEYLQRHVTPAPVTAEMVQDYYNKHPEEFGAETLRDFELLKAPAQLEEVQRDLLLKKIETIHSVSNWSGSAKAWQQELKLQYQQGRNKAGLLHKTLEQKINATAQGETSSVFYIDGELYLVRVNRLEQLPPKALSEVSDNIRKRLAPLLLRDAVKKASEEARSKVKVVLSAADNTR
jgi:PPIC-type PPIASE domain/SurA N-terminal domain